MYTICTVLEIGPGGGPGMSLGSPCRLQGRYSQRQSLGSMIPDLIKDDSFVLISSLSGPNDLDEESCSLIGSMEGRLVIPANSVRLSSLPKIVYEFHQFPAKNLGFLDLFHFISIISSL